nr:hypothetical protein [Paracoccus mutanolyticus]
MAARIKADLLKEFNLHTVLRLPEGVFAPYTDIPTISFSSTRQRQPATSGTTNNPNRKGGRSRVIYFSRGLSERFDFIVLHDRKIATKNDFGLTKPEVEQPSRC